MIGEADGGFRLAPVVDHFFEDAVTPAQARHSADHTFAQVIERCAGARIGAVGALPARVIAARDQAQKPIEKIAGHAAFAGTDETLDRNHPW